MSGKVIYITGGARSGKSKFAESLAIEQGHKILYIATAVPVDGEMQDRILKHRERRPSFWQTLEAYKGIKQKLDVRGEKFHGILMDCVTIMITNLLVDAGLDNGEWNREQIDGIEQSILKEVMETLKGLRTWAKTGIIVSNEVGMGLVPDNFLGRIYRDIAGRINQVIASESDEVYLTVSGIPVRIK